MGMLRNIALRDCGLGASLLLLLLGAGRTLGAQILPPDGWVVGSQAYSGVMVLDPVFQPCCSPPLGRETFYDWGAPTYIPSGYHSVDPQTQSIVYTALVPYGVGVGPRLFVDRKRLWGADLYASGKVWWIYRDRGNATTTLVDLRALMGLPSSILYDGWCSNGREMFFSIGVTSATTHHIFAADIRSSPPPIRPLAALPVSPNGMRYVRLKMGDDGDVMVLDRDVGMFRLNPVTGGMTQVTGPYYGASPPRAGNTPEFAYNVWNKNALVTDMTTASIDRFFGYDGTQWRYLFLTPFGSGWRYPSTTAPTPFLLFGRGCLTSQGLEPLLGWRGLPRQGTTFSIDLRNAEPNGLALFWVGMSDRFWSVVGALPFDGAPYGAPGCQLLVSADSTTPTLVDASGHASRSITMPLNPALAGWEVYAQAACSSAGNAFGFVTSDAVAIRTR